MMNPRTTGERPVVTAIKFRADRNAPGPYWGWGFLAMWLAGLTSLAAEPTVPLTLQLRSLPETGKGTGQYQRLERKVQWLPQHTAVIVCDMWDHHWCRGATKRVAEMAPRMNQVIQELRRRGVLIIHCPSDTLGFYQDHPARQLARSAPKVDIQPLIQSWSGLNARREPALPIDDSDGGCDDEPQCKSGKAWSRQIAALEIKDGDAITDTVEAFYLMRQRGITNVMVMGVHENMCILNRPFSIRQMVKLGQNVVLVRDLTDTMYNSRRPPNVDHFAGNDLVTWHIEKHWCPTITSDQIIGGQPFHFAADVQPPRIFLNSAKPPTTSP
jgi:nicotinamidase-related amidase